MNRFLQKLLTGNNFSQEYLCLAENAYALHFSYMMETQQGAIDITSHLFLGYQPVILGVESIPGLPEIHSESNLQVVFPSAGPVARMRLRRMEGLPGSEVALFAVIDAQHNFLPAWQQAFSYWLEKMRSTQGTIRLSQEEHKALRIAYARPRRISLVTLSRHGLFNLFPTDLHGRNGTDYLDSLRIDGEAAKQVQETGRMVIAHVAPEAATLAYSLGRNHRQPMKSRDQFPLGDRVSKVLGLPLPPQMVGYDELELLSFADAGIHRIFRFRILHSEALAHPTLAHVHAVPAGWREKNGVGTDYLLRPPEPPPAPQGGG